jgi:hypothetical protein
VDYTYLLAKRDPDSYNKAVQVHGATIHAMVARAWIQVDEWAGCNVVYRLQTGEISTSSLSPTPLEEL